MYCIHIHTIVYFEMWHLKFIAVALCLVCVNGALDIVIKKYHECCGTGIDYELKHHANFTKINSTVTLASGGSLVPFDLDDTIMIHFLLEKFMDGEWKRVHSFEKRDPCALLNKYVGEMWYDIESTVNLPRGKCPIPKGQYDAENVILDFNKLPITTAHRGPLRATVKAFKGEKEFFCWYVEADIL